jgi:hypothetical protein
MGSGGRALAGCTPGRPRSLSRRGLFLAQSNAAQRGTHIRHRNRRHFDGAVAVVPIAAALADDLSQSVRCAWHPTRQKSIGEFVSEALKNIVKV